MKLDLLDYNNLQHGETRQGNCPSCGKNKFYVTRKTDGLAYICHRASCPTQGFVGDRYAESIPPFKPKTTMAEFTGELYPIDSLDIDYFWQRFHIDLDLDDLKTTGDSRYAFPLIGPDDRLRGHVIRRASWTGKEQPPIRDDYGESFPKALTYIHPDVPRCGWYHSMNEQSVVMVEDCVSAMRIAQLGVTAVALLGTTLSPKVLGEILRWKNGKHYILALDPDAQDKARKIQRDYGPAFRGGLHVAELKCDPKDYTEDEDLIRDLGLL